MRAPVLVRARAYVRASVRACARVCVVCVCGVCVCERARLCVPDESMRARMDVLRQRRTAYFFVLSNLKSIIHLSSG